MSDVRWIKEAPMAITVTDADGIILEMNDRAENTFEKDGGRNLIGSNVLDCHPEPARARLAGMLKDGTSNIYTIEKKGMKKMIVQMPWYSDGKPAGLVELSIELPQNIPHFVRK
jgi:transcriptional regulator with PAS, ATPase and Fis domain